VSELPGSWGSDIRAERQEPDSEIIIDPSLPQVQPGERVIFGSDDGLEDFYGPDGPETLYGPEAVPQPAAEDEEPDEARWPPGFWRELITTGLELLGIGSLTAGFWLLRPFCGLICLGLCLIILGVVISLQGRESDARAESDGTAG
jgi:hypothetical protein